METDAINTDYPKDHYPFTKRDIDKYVADEPGVYLLGDIIKQRFLPRYVGRTQSRSDLNERLTEHLNDEQDYQAFKYRHTNDETNAYRFECDYYHDLISKGYPLENALHPDKPDNLQDKIQCPICNQ